MVIKMRSENEKSSVNILNSLLRKWRKAFEKGDYSTAENFYRSRKIFIQ